MQHGFFRELKRRHVYRVGVAYAVVGWLVIQAEATLAPALHLPDSLATIVVVVVALGFPITLLMAWAFEMTPEGVRRTEPVDSEEARAPEQHRKVGRTLNAIIMGVLVVAVALLAWRLWAPRKASSGLSQAAASAPSRIPPATTSVAPASSTFPPNSIAVLPFANLSADKNQDYFSDGISEDLLNLLAKMPKLQVTARSSSFYFKGKNLPISEIARRLHVAYILEGSVQKVGNQVRISAQLVDTASDTQRWSQTWDRTFDDIFKIQDEVAADVVKALKIKLLGAAPTVLPTDPKAYALFLQAKELGRQITKEAFAQSDALYRQVLAIDPRYAPAWDGLAVNFINETAMGGLLSNQEGYARAREAAEKALAIDPGYAHAHASLGWIAMAGDNDLAGAAKHFEHALTLDPTDPGVLDGAAALLRSLGRLDEALALQEAIVRRDPVSEGALANLGYTQRLAGRYDAAIASFRTALSLSPGMEELHYQLGVALLFKHEPKVALGEIEQETSVVWRMIGLPMAYCGLGRKADAEKAFTALIGRYEKDRPYEIAYDYAYCGEADKAFEWLDKAVQYQDPDLGDIVPDNPFDTIHADPRWLPFLHKIGKAPDQLAKIKFRVSLPKAWQTDATDGAAASGESGN